MARARLAGLGGAGRRGASARADAPQRRRRRADHGGAAVRADAQGCPLPGGGLRCLRTSIASCRDCSGFAVARPASGGARPRRRFFGPRAFPGVMPRLLVIDDRDQTIELCHRHLPQFDYVTRCGRSHPCQVCEERDKGCPYKCAHNAAEAAEALRQEEALPDLVVLDLHFALPEAQLLPRSKDGLDLEQVRRTQGGYILEQLRKDCPTLPVVLLNAK